MTSPAKRHFARVLAAQVNDTSGEQRTSENATQYELTLGKLAQDKAALKQIQSVELKAELKRKLLVDYQPWIQGVLQGDSGMQDDVLTTIMVWLIDTGDLTQALILGNYCIRHGLKMPDTYKRSPAVLIAEEFADISLKLFGGGHALDTASLAGAIDLVKDQDMPDQVRAKLIKAYAYGLRQDAPTEDKPEERLTVLNEVITQLKRALELFEGVGVKKDIETLEREVKNLAEKLKE
jgi:hypothetical protein